MKTQFIFWCDKRFDRKRKKLIRGDVLNSLNLFFLLSMATFSSFVAAQRPMALIYRGPGSCVAESGTTGCSEAAQNIAEQAGFDVVFVGPTEANRPEFQTAQVWIQPGGRARTQAATMTPQLKQAIKDFVTHGGGYVGFCAGAFLSTETFGWEDFLDQGLGFFPGQSFYYDLFDPELSARLQAKIVPVEWNGKKRQVYWELGPYFAPASITHSTEVVAYYPKLKSNTADVARAMTIRGSFGSGRVFVTAVHPEAPQDWRDYYKIKDDDGLDWSLAKDMILWAAKKAH